MIITTKIFESYLICKYKTHLRLRGETLASEFDLWVFTNMEDVVFAYSERREGSFLKDFLVGFSGVLVSDFYAVYDSIDCPQQKCLVHLIRDMNDDLLKNPFNEEFKKSRQRLLHIAEKHYRDS
jgi:hypothetical protein